MFKWKHLHEHKSEFQHFIEWSSFSTILFVFLFVFWLGWWELEAPPPPCSSPVSRRHTSPLSGLSAKLQKLMIQSRSFRETQQLRGRQPDKEEDDFFCFVWIGSSKGRVRWRSHAVSCSCREPGSSAAEGPSDVLGEHHQPQLCGAKWWTWMLKLEGKTDDHFDAKLESFGRTLKKIWTIRRQILNFCLISHRLTDQLTFLENQTLYLMKLWKNEVNFPADRVWKSPAQQIQQMVEASTSI